MNFKKIFTHKYRIVIFKNGKFCWEPSGWIKNDEGLCRWWRWNRFYTWIYHVGRKFKFDKLDQRHLSECKHCKEGFKKWLDKNKET